MWRFCYLYRILQQRLRVIKRIVFPVSQKSRQSMVQCVSVSVCVSHSDVWSEARSVNQWSWHGSAKTCSVMIGHKSQAKTGDIARIGTILIGQRHNDTWKSCQKKCVLKLFYWSRLKTNWLRDPKDIASFANSWAYFKRYWLISKLFKHECTYNMDRSLKEITWKSRFTGNKARVGIVSTFCRSQRFINCILQQSREGATFL